jgi:hypothetical protein
MIWPTRRPSHDEARGQVNLFGHEIPAARHDLANFVVANWQERQMQVERGSSSTTLRFSRTNQGTRVERSLLLIRIRRVPCNSFDAPTGHQVGQRMKTRQAQWVERAMGGLCRVRPGGARRADDRTPPVDPLIGQLVAVTSELA